MMTCNVTTCLRQLLIGEAKLIWSYLHVPSDQGIKARSVSSKNVGHDTNKNLPLVLASRILCFVLFSSSLKISHGDSPSLLQHQSLIPQQFCLHLERIDLFR